MSAITRVVSALLAIGLSAGSLASQTRMLAPTPGRGLTLVTPTGPAPAGFTVTGTPNIAQLSWAGAGNASYTVWRGDGPASPIQRTPANFSATVLVDTVPDHTLTYHYRLVATYSDGTWGEAALTFVPPPPSNPASLSATSLGRAAYQLSWPAVAGATGYRVDGATIPVTGWMISGLSTNVINVPPGPQSWQVIAVFPGGLADYNTPRKVSVIHRIMPPHPAWLVKNNGLGDVAKATAHANTLGGGRDITSILGSAGVTGGWSNGNYSYEDGPVERVDYVNTADLGRPRRTACHEGIRDDRYTVCYTESGNTMSVIVKGSRGTRFATLQVRGGIAYNAYWGDKWATVLQATLDSEGPRFTPHACTSCHGGTYNPGTGLVEGATLLPIDPGMVQLADRNAAEEPIRKLNARIFLSQPTAAVQTYIAGMYGGNILVPGAKAAANYVPSGWTSDANFYLGVVKKNCQMCHLATPPGREFLSAGNFLANKQQIHASVCQNKTMPHAEVPYRTFWTEDTGPIYRPGLLAAWLGFASCP